MEISSFTTQDPLLALFAAIETREKKPTYPYFAGMMGGLGRLPFCSIDCLCAERQQRSQINLSRLDALGFSARSLYHTNTSQTKSRLARDLRIGKTIYWKSNDKAGASYGWSRKTTAQSPIAHDLGGEYTPIHLSLDELSSLETYTFARSASRVDAMKARQSHA